MSRLKVPVILAIAAAAVGLLLFAGASRNDIYMSTLAQFDRDRARHESVRVMGFVKEGSIAQEKDALVTTFVIRDEAGALTLPVRFSGVTPGLFRDGTSVVAGGRLAEDGTFAATDLMTKCPSKYEGMPTPHGDQAAEQEPSALRL